jgi:hypothetical protein
MIKAQLLRICRRGVTIDPADRASLVRHTSIIHRSEVPCCKKRRSFALIYGPQTNLCERTKKNPREATEPNGTGSCSILDPTPSRPRMSSRPMNFKLAQTMVVLGACCATRDRPGSDLQSPDNLLDVIRPKHLDAFLMRNRQDIASYSTTERPLCRTAFPFTSLPNATKSKTISGKPPSRSYTA